MENRIRNYQTPVWLDDVTTVSKERTSEQKEKVEETIAKAAAVKL